MPPRARTPSSGDNSPRRRRRFCGCKRNIDIVFTVGTLIICALLLNLAILLNRYGAHRTAQPEVAGGHHGHDSISAGRISSKHYAGTRAIGVASSRQRPDARSTAPPAASIAASVAAETIPATAAPAVSVELAAAVADAAVAGPAAVVVEATTQPPTAPTEAPTAAPPATAAPNQIIAAAAAVVTTVKAAAPATPTTAPAAATAADAFPTGPVVDGISVLPDRGALWDRNLCPRRKDNKPYKIHVWFSHVQEAGGRTYEYLFAKPPLSAIAAMHPGAGHKSIADLREAHQQFIAKSGDRCHVLATVLRHPVERVLAEYSVGIRRATGTSAAGLETYDCNHSDCTDTDLTNRMGQGTISLAEYVTYNHRSRSPNNRHTYMLSGMKDLVNDPMLAADPTVAATALARAKAALDEMPWFAVHEYLSDSIFLLDMAFGSVTPEFTALSVLDRAPVPKASELDPDTRALIEKHNQLDLELYKYALELLAMRVQAALQVAPPTGPARRAQYACEPADCGTHVNERLYAESPLFAYRDAVRKPWHTLCTRRCLKPTEVVSA